MADETIGQDKGGTMDEKEEELSRDDAIEFDVDAIEFDVDDVQRIKMSLIKYVDSHHLEIRYWFQALDGEWHPTKRGMFLPLDKLPPNINEAIAREFAISNVVPLSGDL